MREIRIGDCREVMAGMAAASVDAVVTDPPYFKVKDDDWDHQWAKRSHFLEWMGDVADEWRRILKPNGSLYVFASPNHATAVENVLAERFRVLNRIIWRKGEGIHRRQDRTTLRRYFPQTEHIIFAEQFESDGAAMSEAGYAAKCEQLRGQVFQPIWTYLRAEWQRAGLSFKEADKACGVAGMASGHYFGSHQFCLPTAEHYASLQAYANRNGGDFLGREYGDLRREYEDLRRPFNVEKPAPYTDVWDHDVVLNYRGKHPAEKPVALMRDIVAASTRPGDLVLDSFCGSGTTGVACAELGRRFLGIELDERWAARAQTRIQGATMQQRFDLEAAAGD